MVLSINHQTQTALASLNLSLQSIGAEVVALKEQLASKPLLKRKKVYVYIFTQLNTCVKFYMQSEEKDKSATVGEYYIIPLAGNVAIMHHARLH